MRYEAAVRLDAPPEWAWEWLEDDANFAVTHPGLLDHLVTEILPNGAHHCVQVVSCKRHGSHRITVTCLEYEPPIRSRERQESDDGAIQVGARFLEPVGDGAVLRHEVELVSLPNDSRGRWSRRLLVAGMRRQSQATIDLLGAAVDAAYRSR